MQNDSHPVVHPPKEGTYIVPDSVDQVHIVSGMVKSCFIDEPNACGHTTLNAPVPF